MRKIINKTIAAVLTILMIITAIPPSTVWAEGNITLTVTPSAAAANVGDEISFTVSMGSAAGTNFGAFSFELAIPEGMAFKPGSGALNPNFRTATGLAVVTFDEEPRLLVSGYGDSAYNGGGLDIATFTCIAVSGGNKIVGLKEVDFLDNSVKTINASVNPANIAVKGELTDVSGTITFNGGSYTYDGTQKTLPPASTTDGSGGVFTYTYTGTGNTNYPSSANAPVNAGTYSVTAAYESSVSAGTKSADLVISRAELTITSVSAVDRDYNGTTNVSLTGGTLVGVVDSDKSAVAFNLGNGVIADANVGNNKNVTTYFTLTGSRSGNYTLMFGGAITVNISAADSVYTVAAAQNFKMGAGLSSISVPENGTGIGGSAVSGSIAWFSDAGRTVTALDSDLSSLGLGATKELYWRFTPNSANYRVKEGAVTFTVVNGDPQPLAFATPVSVSKTYGDAVFTNAAAHVGGSASKGVISYASDNPAVAAVNAATGTVTIVSAGTAVITATAAGVPGLWAETSGNYTLVVNKKIPAAGEFDYSLPGATAYDALAHAVAVTPKSNLNGFGTVTAVRYNGSANPPVNAGLYAVTVEVNAGSNYAAAVVALGSFNISPKAMTNDMLLVTGGPYVYNGTSQSPSYTVTDGSELSAENYSVTSLPAQINAGSYQLVIAGRGNYSGTATQNFVINKKPVSGVNGEVAVKSGFARSYEFDLRGLLPAEVKADQISAYSYTGMSGDAVIDSGTIAVSGSRLSFSTLASAADSQSAEVNIGFTSGNYTILEAVLTVSAKDGIIVAVSGAAISDRTYNGLALAYDVSTVVFSDADTGDLLDIEPVLTWSSGISPANAGSYTLTISAEDDVRYVINPLVINFRINKAALTLRAEDKSITANSTLPAFTFTAEGFVGGDSWQSVSASAPVIGTAALNTATAGTYPITISGGTLNETAGLNYVISQYVSGVLTITEAVNPPEREKYTLTITVGIGGRVSGTSSGAYEVYRPISVTATANSGYIFNGWLATGVTLGSVTANPAVFVMPARDVTLVANFVSAGGGNVNNGGNSVGSGGSSGASGSGSLGGVVSTRPAVTLPADRTPLASAPSGVPGAGAADLQSNSFSDVKAADWFYDDVVFVVSRSLMNGTAADKFSPNTPMTRAMLVTVLWRLAGSPAATGSNIFEDVASGIWYTDAVIWANANGIVQGVGDRRFDPNTPMSRQDLAVVLARYIDVSKIDIAAAGVAQDFADGSGIADYAKAGVNELTRCGLIRGKADNLFDPQGSATRAEVAAIFHRLVNASAR